MEVYLDNSATTKPYDEVAKTVYNTMLSDYANPSSVHILGKKAEDLLTKCREIVSSTVYCTPEEIYFTQGGTQSDNAAILGYCLANRRKGGHILCQRTEHAAVLESLKYLESQGFEVVYVPVCKDGKPDREELSRLAKGALLMCFMYVNNETGAVLPIEEIAKIAKKEGCALFVDAVQAYGKIPIDVRALGVDMMSISSHKIHGPNGVGALYCKKGTKISPVVYGGNQERGLFSGTENLAGIAGFAKACEIKFASMKDDAAHMQKLKEKLCQNLLANLCDIKINSPEDGICSIANISFPGIKSEVLLHVLESNGIYVSSGSACSSKKNKTSYVLKQMGLSAGEAEGAIRFSFSPFNTEEEIDYVCEVLRKQVPLLGRIMK